MTQAIRGFDSAFEHQNSSEKWEFLQLLIHRAKVYPDRVDVELYDGRSASRFLAQVTRNGVVLGPRDEEGRNATGREPVQGFAAGDEWLPTTDGARTGVQGLFLRLSKRFPRRGQVEVVEVAPKLSKQERAERWAAMIDGVGVRTRAELARKLGVSRARVTQVLGAA